MESPLSIPHQAFTLGVEPQPCEETALQFFRKIKSRADTSFFSPTKEWNNKSDFNIPEDILKGITEGLNFKRPTKIQAVAIPMFLK